uniref:Uncharacterized protein n=1 Tax=Anguilla anguilla TaxID=7936 RepID=A0A0E9XT37_ANGAN
MVSPGVVRSLLVTPLNECSLQHVHVFKKCYLST